MKLGDHTLTTFRSTALIAVIATLAMVCAALPTTAMGAISPIIMADVGINNFGLGSLSATALSVGVITSMASGKYTDRVSGTSTIVGLFVAAGGSFVLMSLSGGYPALLFSMGLAGLSIGASNPATNDITIRHVPARHQGSVVGIKQSGVFIGSVLAGFIIAPLAVRYGWRDALLVTGVVVMLVAPLSRWAIASRPRLPSSRYESDRTSDRYNLPLHWLIGMGFFAGAATSCVSLYVTVFAHTGLGFDSHLAAWPLAVLGIFGAIGRVLWAEFTARTGYALGGLLIIGLVATAGIASILTSAVFDAPIWLWVGVVLVGSSGGAFTAIAMVIVVRGWTGKSPGHASGAVQAGHHSGLVLSPLVFGAVVDASGSYVYGWLYVLGTALCTSGIAVWTYRLGYPSD